MSRSSRKVSGPRHENIKNPSVAKAVCHCFISVCGSSALCKCMFAHSMSTVPSTGEAYLTLALLLNKLDKFHLLSIIVFFAIFLIATSAINSQADGKKHTELGYFSNNATCASCPPRTAPQCVQAFGCKFIHCNRSTMRLATSSCSQGVAAGAMRCQCAAAWGEMVGGRSLVILSIFST